MSFVCSNCGKGTVAGKTSSHHRGVAGKRWRKRAETTLRVFIPNLQKVDGKLLCTRCIKKLKAKN